MEHNPERYFLSVAIPYVNANPHIGYALELVQADVLARFWRSQGREVFFCAGTDENALKNVQAAEAAGKGVEQYVAEHAAAFEQLARDLLISNTDFIHTATDPRHRRGAEKLWQACTPEDIYKKTYRGLYCVGCEEFKTEKELVGGECPEHLGKKLEQVEEENYFLRLSAYQAKLENLIVSGELSIYPESRRNETLSFIRGGLEDFSISRSRARAKNWGIPVPGDESQIMYVWFDALSNYINALGYADDSPQFQTFWTQGTQRVHHIGKGINRFHTIYWPAMLLSAGLPLPTTVLVHGYINVGGQKMSKSLGNVVDPQTYIGEYGAEAVRYFLLRAVSTFEDGDFTAERFREVYTADLANGLGNLASRVLKLLSVYAPEPCVPARVLPGEFVEFLEQFEIQKAVESVWKHIAELDGRIESTKLYQLVKSQPERGIPLLKKVGQELADIAYALQSILPETSARLLDLLSNPRMPESPLFPRK